MWPKDEPGLRRARSGRLIAFVDDAFAEGESAPRRRFGVGGTSTGGTIGLTVEMDLSVPTSPVPGLERPPPMAVQCSLAEVFDLLERCARCAAAVMGEDAAHSTLCACLADLLTATRSRSLEKCDPEPFNNLWSAAAQAAEDRNASPQQHDYFTPPAPRVTMEATLMAGLPPRTRLPAAAVRSRKAAHPGYALFQATDKQTTNKARSGAHRKGRCTACGRVLWRSNFLRQSHMNACAGLRSTCPP